MSGGSYNHAYQRIRELADSIEDKLTHPESLELLSPKARAARKAFVRKLRQVADAARAIEWVDSDDSGPDSELIPIRVALSWTQIPVGTT